MDRPDKEIFTETPAHHLGKPHRGKDSGHRFGENLGGRPTLVNHGGGEIVALVGGLGLKLVNRHAGLLGKALGRFGG